MRKIVFVNGVLTAGGFLLLCAAPILAYGQSTQSSAVPPPAPMKSALPPRGRSAQPPDFLDGLELADDQKAKIAQIREDTKSRMAATETDKRLSPEAADAMRRGYQRLENGKILEVLTLEQQTQVRKRMAAFRAAAGKPQYPMRKLPASQ